MQSELFIASRIPEFAEKNEEWFRHNRRTIEKGRHLNTFWEHNSIVITHEWRKGLRTLTERLLELGYEINSWPERRGEFTIRGGALIISPIGTDGIWHIDFFGNQIDDIRRLPPSAHGESLERKIKDRSLLEYLRGGDFVVHEHHGIGLWRGITTEGDKKYFHIEYRGPKGGDADTLMVPITEAARISPYIGFRAPKVSRLGTPVWKKTLRQTKDDAIAFAKKLLAVHAMRNIVSRPPYAPSPEIEEKLEASFPFEETAAQKRALTRIWQDLSSKMPMDRIIIGDVGFGKTELALRTSVRVATNSKQVAILAPTTILAAQHYETWKKRLAGLPIKIARLSRLEDASTIKKALAGIRDGTIDIAIGTHRILSRDITFKNLGLLIVDEEQRFGVGAKEKLKELKAEVDVLTLSATPLPRTLSLALARVRAMTALDEGPVGKIAPETLILPYQPELMARALEIELQRKGQVYVVESRIHRIPKTLELIRKLVPKSKVGYLHGRMNEKELVETMESFRKGDIEILVSTTIIENGVDLHTVNTLIVTDAVMYGLADLHQLRGRIGRGTLQSYAYFFYNPAHLTPKAERRLDILQDTQFLGAGSVIAEKDLEMRGAGNILGREQSGVAARVGLNLYSQFLADAVERLRSHDDTLRKSP